METRLIMDLTSWIAARKSENFALTSEVFKEYNMRQFELNKEQRNMKNATGYVMTAEIYPPLSPTEM